MTSNGPYSQSMNFTHMFDFTDLRGPYPKREPCKNSLLGIITNNPDFKKFNFMVRRAGLEEFLNSPQANFTIFVPSDKALDFISEDLFTNMDILTARRIVKTSMLYERIPAKILEDSPAAYYYTTDTTNRLFITNLSGITYINNNIKLIEKDILLDNGIIHVIDNLIIPHII